MERLNAAIDEKEKQQEKLPNPGPRLAKSGVELARKQKLPDFEFTLGYKTNKEKMVEETEMGLMLEDRKPTWKVEIMAMLPIWQGNKIKADIKAAEANLAAAEAALTNMKNMTELDVQMALADAQASWRQIDLYKNTIIPQAEQTYQAATVSYTNGKTDFMTVLEAVNTLRNAKLGLYKAKVDYEKAIANLEKAVGKPLFVNVDITKIK
ncbi:TolC family protein [Sporolituus thermophilus]|uniref:Outer membrane efflux protein n=1 Tax=Sporolituus thermophilus DSM 23256 TaxID=1123285 RepID=A0A1G7KZM5_9FIRM|nr:TolC family protein [Sporolituus thermophilus]SDF42524.1 Outer membrane efflux protein [Sporolituus thermophilus DSM 23256]